jgi:hypothetical protein
MYLACRHIKPNGTRCQSPALRGHAFCYFHSRLHSTTRIGIMDDVRLPLPEDAAAIQLSIARISEALLASRIDCKHAAQLLWGLQIASQTVPRGAERDPESIPSLTVNKDGEELAPVARICNGFDSCKNCKFADGCTNLEHYIYEHGDELDAEDDDDDD